MGHRDLTKLHQIYQEVNQICKDDSLHFQFNVDDGNYETRIDINEKGDVFLGNGKLPLIGFEMFCPDLLDFHNKIILEFEEEAKPNKGAKRRRGHFEGNNHDKVRDDYYGKAKFRFLKIWESDKDWIAHLREFLKTCSMDIVK